MRFSKSNVTIVAGSFIILLACLALVGKYFHISSFATHLPGVVSMKFNSAIFFLLSGVALLLLSYPKARPVVLLCSWLVLAGSILTLAEYIFHRSFGIDDWLWKPDAVKTKDPFPARPSAVAAFNFILISITLLLTRKKRAHLFIWILLQLVFLVSVLAFITYAFSIATPNSFATFTNLFLHTAAMFMVLCAAIFYSEPLRELKISFQRKLVAGFVLILLVLSIVFLIYKANGDLFTKTSESVSHTNEVLRQCEESVSAMIATESATSNFLLTGNERYAGSYTTEKNSTFLHLYQLKKLIADNPVQKRTTDSLNKEINTTIILLDRLVLQRKNNRSNLPASINTIVSGSAGMDRIRLLFSRVQAEEKKLLAERTEVNEVNVSNAKRIFYFFGFVMPFILIILGIVIFRNSNAKKKAEEKAIGLAATLEKRVAERTDELLKSEKRFKTIIESSNDIISLSDEKFIPFYRSPSAAKITGWLEDDKKEAGSVIDRTHPDDIDKFRADIQTSYQRPGEAVPVSFRTRSKKGDYIWLEGYITNLLHDEALGAIITNMQDVSSRKESEQAVAALNQGLEEKVNQKTAQLQDSIKELQSTQQQLVQQAKLASLGELTAGIAHEIQNPLNFVNNFAELNTELLSEIKELIGDKDSEISDILGDIDENSKKIRFHGNRADNIVKSMLQHSRRNTGNKELTDLGSLADEYLRLSYHGLRAKDKSFNAKFEIDIDPAVGKVTVVPQDMGRVLLNLINNAFHAVAEKKKTSVGDYDPTVWVRIKRIDAGHIGISIRDNGTGMPEKVKEKIFQPFFTTKPTGQGTGLGLSISNDIITQTHGGELKVNTHEGEGTEFIISLPV